MDESHGRTAPERRSRVARVAVDRQGRVLIPAEMRQALSLKAGDALTLHVDEHGVIRLRSTAQALKAAQDYLRRLVPDDTSLSDELIADRRAEAAREARE